MWFYMNSSNCLIKIKKKVLKTGNWILGNIFLNYTGKIHWNQKNVKRN